MTIQHLIPAPAGLHYVANEHCDSGCPVIAFAVVDGEIEPLFLDNGRVYVGETHEPKSRARILDDEGCRFREAERLKTLHKSTCVNGHDEWAGDRIHHVQPGKCHQCGSPQKVFCPPGCGKDC